MLSGSLVLRNQDDQGVVIVEINYIKNKTRMILFWYVFMHVCMYVCNIQMHTIMHTGTIRVWLIHTSSVF